MTAVGKFVSASAITWAASELRKLPKDQLALIFALIVSKVPNIDYPRGVADNPFTSEMKKYLWAPKSISANGIFNPIDGQWRADNYFQSTVFGRLLNGSHSWTSPEVGYFERLPKSGWPAKIEFSEDGFGRLFLRTAPPCLKFEYRLPILALAIYYYRQINLSALVLETPQDLVDHYSTEVLSSNPLLTKLFIHELPVFWGQLFQDTEIDPDEYVACFAGTGMPSGITVRVTQSDMDDLQSLFPTDLTADEMIQQLIKKAKEKHDNS